MARTVEPAVVNRTCCASECCKLCLFCHTSISLPCSGQVRGLQESTHVFPSMLYALPCYGFADLCQLALPHERRLFLVKRVSLSFFYFLHTSSLLVTRRNHILLKERKSALAATETIDLVETVHLSVYTSSIAETLLKTKLKTVDGSVPFPRNGAPFRRGWVVNRLGGKSQMSVPPRPPPPPCAPPSHPPSSPLRSLS